MGPMDRYNEKKKKQQETASDKTSSSGPMQRYETQKYYSQFDTSAVNEAYIDAFYKDWNSFSSSAEKDYGGLGWSNASSSYESRNTTWQDLSARADTISAWLYKNRRNLTDEEYDSYNKELDDIRTSGFSVLDTFKEARDYYAQWATEDAYNRSNDAILKRLGAVSSAEDFAEYSQLGAGVSNPSYKDAHPGFNLFGWMPFGDGEDINNMVTFAEANKKNAEQDFIMNPSNPLKYTQIVNLINQHMKDEEKAIYNYYVGKGDTASANEYLEHITDVLKQREGGRLAGVVDDTVFEALVSFTAGAEGGFQGLINFARGVEGKEGFDTSINQHTHSEAIKNNEGIWKAANDLAYTTGNMTPSILAGSVATAIGGPLAGKIVGASVTGLSSAGNSYAQMIEQGYGVNQARKYGAMVGVAEGGLSYLFSGISKAGGKLTGNVINKVVDGIDNGIARFFTEFAINSTSEAIEEGAQSILEPIFKMIATGEDFEGVDWSEVGYSAMLGALSAGLLEGVPNAVGGIHSNYQTSVEMGGLSNKGAIQAFRKGAESGTKGFRGVYEAYKAGQQNVNEAAGYYASEALEIDPENAHAQRMQARLGKEKNVSGLQINRMIEANENALVSGDKAKMKAAIEQRLTELGETGDISKLADVIVKQKTGEKLSRSENAEIESSIYGKRILNEMDSKNIASGEYASDWNANLGTNRIGADVYNRGVSSESVAEAGQAEAVATTENAPVAEATAQGGISAPKVALNNNPIPAVMKDSENNDVSVKVAKIASVEDGEAVLELADGKTVKASDVDFGEGGIGFVYKTAIDMMSGVGGFNVDSANVMVRGFDPNGTADQAIAYVGGFNKAFRNGALGYPSSSIETDRALSALPMKQRELAYNLGQIYGAGKVSEKQANIDSAKAKASGKAAKKGRVYFDGSVAGKKLTETQRASLKALGKIAEAMGIDIHIFESPLVNGKRVGENGRYNPTTKKLEIDLHAGANGNGLMLYTASHELTHHIKNVSPAKFKVFADALLEEYTKNGISVDKLIAQKIDDLRKNKRIKPDMTEEQIYDYALEEVVADACEAMLVDSNAIEALSRKLQAQDKGLWETIKDFIAKLVERIKNAYKGLDPDSMEANLVRDMADSAERLQKLWVEALLDAAETQQTIGTRSLEDFAEAKNENGDTLFQFRAMQEDEAIYRDMLKKWGGMSSVQIDSLFSTIEKAMDIIEDNLEELDYAWEADVDDRAFSPVKPNSDKLYQVSLDFSTLCRKRILQQTVAAHLQEQLNKPLSRDEGIAIRDALIALQEEGRRIEVACALCYVESARMKSPPQIKKFFDNREKHLKEFFASKSGGDIKEKIKSAEAKAREKLRRENPDGILGKDGKTMLNPLTASLNSLPKKYAEEIRAAKKSAKESYKPTAEEQKLIDIAKGMTVNEFTSPEGLETLLKSHPRLYDAYTSFVRNATKSKGIEGDTWWRAGDSDSIGDTLIANMNRENGLRSQSWSDFQVIHLLDYIAATIELSTRNTKEQAYTKVPDYVELMGLTGVMINMSLIPTAKFNGSLAYDPVEGIDYKKSLELRDKYPDTAGTICIGMNNTQIQLLLADTSIDYVIPYHKSGMSQAVRKLMHIPTWEQYEEYQSEKNLPRDQAKKQAEKYGVKLLPESDPNYHKGTNFSDWFDLAEAKQIAKMENANPSDMAKKEQYGVMYGGYMAMQNAAQNYLKLCAERGISPKFSHEKADFTVEDNYWKLLIDRKMVNNKTGEIIEQKTIKPIFSETEVLRILNDELERYPNVKEDQDYAIRIVTEKMLSGDIKGGMSAKEIAKAVKKPVDNVTNVNIMASGDTLYSDRATSNAISDMDSDGNTLSAEQKEFFKDSAIRDEDGNLQVVYHGTTSEFNTFEVGDIGYHFGSEVQAENRLSEQDGEKRFIKAYLNIKNPLVVEHDSGSWHGNYAAGAMLAWGDFQSNPEAMTKLQEIARIYDEKKADSELKKFLKSMGYDGVKYLNTHESAKDKESYSYIAFESNQIKAVENEVPTEDPNIMYSDRVTNKETLEFLNDQLKKGEVTKVYRAMQVQPVDENGNVIKAAVLRVVSQSPLMVEAKTFGKNGKTDIYPAKLFSPMAGMVNGKWSKNIELNKWEETSFDLAHATTVIDKKTGKPKIDTDKKNASYGETAYFYGLVKGGIDNNGKKLTDVPARYNPYIHTSLSALNDQFSSANKRPELVTVECIVPNSELTSGFRAEGAKDRVGAMSWHSGPTSSRLAQVGKARTVILTRYDMPIRVLPDSEVAQAVADYIGDSENIAIKESTVTPSLSSELRNLGVSVLNEEEWAKYDEEFPTKTFGKKKTTDTDIRYSDRTSQDDRDISLEHTGYEKVPDSLMGFKQSWKEQRSFEDQNYPYVLNLWVSVDGGQTFDADAIKGMNRKHALERAKRNWPYGEDLVLKERKDDVEYSDRQTDSFSNRSLLLNALRSTAQNTKERTLLTNYKNNLDKIYIEQTDLEKVMSQIDNITNNRSLSILGEEMSVKEFKDRALAKAEKNGIYVGDVKFKLDRNSNKYRAYAIGHGTILEADKHSRGADGRLVSTDNEDKLKNLYQEASEISARINTYDRELLKLEAMEPIRDILNREKKLAYQKAEQRGKEALERQKAKAAETQRALMDRYRESRKKAIENRNKTAIRNKIKNVVKDLDNILNRGTKDRNVKEEMRETVSYSLAFAELIFSDDISNEDIVRLGVDVVTEKDSKLLNEYSDLLYSMEALSDKREYVYGLEKVDSTLLAKVGTVEEKIAKIKNRISALNRELADVFERERARLNKETASHLMESLAEEYLKLKSSNTDYIRAAYDNLLYERLVWMKENIGGTIVKDMSIDQLTEVYHAYKMVAHSVRNANKAFKASKGQTIMQMAEAVNDQIRDIAGQPYKHNAVKVALMKNGWTFLKPYVAFRTIGSVTLTNMYKELRNGEDTFYRDVREAQAFIEAQYEKHGYKSWDLEKTKTFTAKSGKTFELNLEQMMTLYAYYQRNQAHKHIIEGGIVFEGALITEKNKLGVPIKYEVTTKEAFNLSEDTFKGICDYLEQNHKDVVEFVKEMQEYLSKTMGAKGNEVSMELYGVNLFNEDFYLPIKSSQYYMELSVEDAGEFKLKNSSFSKETNHYANNPIVLHNFTDLWAEHINAMSMYHSFVLALEDFRRVYNYRTKIDATVEAMDTKATLETAYPGVNKYISKFLKDMNGGVRGETVGWAEKLTSLAKKGSVLGSASVTIQQPSAVMRAMAYVHPKYFATTAKESINLKKHKADWEELKKYAPIAGIKEMGRFDVGMGQGTVDWIKSNKTKMEKVEDFISIPPALADEITWVSIWNAVKKETASKNPSLSTSSDEFLILAGERFTDVISLSQVYDSVFSRSDLMRNKSWIAKSLTAFMAEPSTTLNMIWDSLVQGVRSGSKKGFARAMAPTGGAIVSAIVVNAALKSIVMAFRDDDEDESYIESYLEHFFGDIADNINPLTLVPFAKDVLSIFKGYDVERMDMALFSDLYNAINALDSEEKNLYEKVSGIIGAISAFCGVPFKNVERDVRGLITTFFGKSEKATVAGTLNAIVEGLTGNEKSNGQQLYEAMLNGDTKQTERVSARFKDQSAVNSAIRKALRENDPRIKEAAKALDGGDFSEYEDILNEIVGEGHFDLKNVKAAILKEYEDMNPEEESTTDSGSEKEESAFEIEWVQMAISMGDTATAKTMREEIINTHIANGKSREEAESSFNSSFSSSVKKLYDGGDISDREAKSMLVNFAGKTSEEAASKVQWWSFKKNYPDYDLSESAVSDYYSDVKPAGISLSVYYGYINKKAKATGVDKNGDGKADSGTKKSEILQIIHSLPISSYQKDVLYRLNGWAESTLYQAPWH